MARLSVSRTVGSLVLASALMGAAGVTPAALAQDAPVETVASGFEHASALLDEGRVVEASETLRELMRERQTTMTDRERQRGYGLLALANKRVRTADPIVLELERAELALKRGDLDEAEAHARAHLLAAEKPSPRATAVIEAVADRREAGVDDTASLAMMQAGKVNRSDQTGGDQPADEPPAVEPIEDLPDQTPQTDLVEQARRAQAADMLSQADQAFAEAKYETARNRYNRVLSQYRPYLSEEEVARAERNLTESQIQLRQDVTGDVGQETTDIRLIAKQAAVAEYDNLVAQANRSSSQGDFEAARDFANRARLRITQSSGLFSQPELDNYQKQVDGLLAQIAQDQTAQIAAAQAHDTATIAKEATKLEAKVRKERDRQIMEQVKRIRVLQADQKYDEALQVVDEILFLDENNPVGLLLRDVITDTRDYQRYEQINRERKRTYLHQYVENMEATIAPRDVVSYPSDWPQISHVRGEPLAGAEPAENRRVLAVLDQKRIPDVDFRDNTMREVVSFIETISQLNMDVDWDSLEQISIDPETPISLSLSNVPLRTLLDRVVEKASASGFGGDRADWAVIDGILTIASDEQIRRNTTLQIYDLRDLVVEVPDFTEAPEIDLNSVLQSGQGGGGQSPFQTNADNQRDRRPLDERLQDVIDIVIQNVDPEGWEDNGGTTGKIEQLNGLLIVTNTPKNHRAIRGLLSQLRQVRAMQINVETRFLLVSQDFFEQIGFDLDVYFDAQNNQVRAAQLNDPTVQASDFFDFTSTGLKRTVTGAGIDTTGDGNVDSFNTQAVVQPDRTSPTSFAQNSFGLTSSLAPNTGIAATILGGAPALGIAGQFLDDIQVDYLVQATQADRRNVSLTAPRLTLTNSQASNMWVATQRSFVSDLQPVVSDSAVGFDPTLQVVSEGVVMNIEGTVSADRRYVTMTVDAAVSEIDGFEQQAVTAVAGGQLVSSADTQSFIQLPTVTVTRVQTTVTVPDQGTILLGGQRLVSESEVETGVPVLSKLPVLNRFFSNRVMVKEESTLLILLKPTILIQNEEEEKNFPGLLDALGGYAG